MRLCCKRGIAPSNEQTSEHPRYCLQCMSQRGEVATCVLNISEAILAIHPGEEHEHLFERPIPIEYHIPTLSNKVLGAETDVTPNHHLVDRYADCSTLRPNKNSSTAISPPNAANEDEAAVPARLCANCSAANIGRRRRAGADPTPRRAAGTALPSLIPITETLPSISTKLFKHLRVADPDPRAPPESHRDGPPDGRRGAGLSPHSTRGESGPCSRTAEGRPLPPAP